jgi:hypothetical protein
MPSPPEDKITIATSMSGGKFLTSLTTGKPQISFVVGFTGMMWPEYPPEIIGGRNASRFVAM